MVKRMLIDARHSEETRVVVVNGTRLEELDVETSTKKQIKGNIYLAKVIRVEPSLQAAFVEYGGNRHGFLAFSEIHPDYFQIPVADRQALLAEQRAEEMRHGGDGEGRHDEAGGDSDGEASSDEIPVDESAQGADAPHHPDHAAELAAEASDVVYDQAPETGIVATEHPGPEGSVTSGEDGAGEMAPEPASGIVETVASEPVPVEMLGGDDPAEVERPRPRSLRNYKIQEVIKRRQIMLVQVVKEERGNKGAALTTYLSLAGRYCVLMPNTARGGGVSRKITNSTDRRRLKSITSELEIPDGMAVIVRTAGQERTKPEIKRDFEYLMRVWDSVRDLTLRSTAPALVYEEGSLIKRAIRDLYARDIEEIYVEGEDAYRMAKDYMRMLTPSHAKKVQPYREVVPLFHRYQVETQLDAMHNPVVQLRSGGYVVINQTEALVAIDVNSGRATRERHIEETAFKTNMEAADEIARQLRLRDLAGLIVIDFIDMEDSRNNAAVERKLKEAMKSDRARIQLGRISHFGLLELSRQRLRPSLQETAFQACAHCGGTGMVRSVESTAVYILRAIEEEGIRRRSSEVTMTVPSSVALYILNHKREQLAEIESRYGFRVFIFGDDTLIPPNYRMDRTKAEGRLEEIQQQPVRLLPSPEPEIEDTESEEEAEEEEVGTEAASARAEESGSDEDHPRRKRRRRKRRRRPEDRGEGGQDGQQDIAAGADDAQADSDEEDEEQAEAGEATEAQSADGENQDEDRPRRRRGKRGGRRRGRRPEDGAPTEGEVEAASEHAESSEAEGPEVQPLEDQVAASGQAVESPPSEAEEVQAKPAGRRSRSAARADGEEAPRPRRTRRPRAAASEPEAEAPSEANNAAEAAPQPETASVPPVEAVEHSAPAPVAVETAPAPSELPAAEAVVVPTQEPAPVPTAAPAPTEPPQPARKGWWNRILS